MYEALVARVRYHIQKANFMGLKEAESTLLLGEAADAIEELLTLKAIADAKIERLESAKAKKKRPPKRLPCTCGRKRLELWWSNEGWFLKCPNCGRESQPERYQSHVNSVWNNGLPKPPMEG